MSVKISRRHFSIGEGAGEGVTSLHLVDLTPNQRGLVKTPGHGDIDLGIINR